jgi:hypothetical protein
MHADTHDVTKHCEQVVITLVSYLGGPRFEFQPRDWQP